ncbi:MAG: ATP-binding protein, partial [Lachnospiraceae bacterium]|nr:ATP-binding protein [Lachnospiraceae bacterium]
MNSVEQINIQIHPRAFSSFGEDLVTNDIVAITELVKNSYDAYAFNATIKFGEDRNGNKYISIKDDGLGMNRDTILNAWATIATPYKKKKPYVERQVDGEKKIRQVSGNKGLGRFSAARLGDEMVMFTKAPNGKTLKAYFDWKSFEDVENISECIMRLEEVGDIYFDISGTEIIIKKLKAIWDKEKI